MDATEASTGEDFAVMMNRYHRPDYPVMVVISGPSGVGKDTVVREIMRQNDGQFHFVVTATSRPPREGEVDGIDYIFVSEEQFEEMINAGELLEYAFVHDNYKGVPKQQIRDALASGKDVILRVDPQGVATLKNIVPDAVFIFLMPESEEVLAERLRARRTETETSYQLRLEIARMELQRIPEFDYCVVNREGELEQTIRQIKAIITATHCLAVPHKIEL